MIYTYDNYNAILGLSSGSSHGESGDESGDNQIDDNVLLVVDQEHHLELFNILEERKKYLLGKIKPFSSPADINNHTSQHIKTYIDYKNAQLIAQYLATKRPFSQSFDGYLKKIILVVK